MKIYALVGKSGTGKSYQAVNVCREKNIDSMIDDGLFIYGSNIVTGISAKRQPTMIKAIKTALFTEDEHMQEVAQKIREVSPDSILVIGTSERMVWQIVTRLELPPIEEFIYIEDITSEKERAEAHKQRNEQGMHVIPAPAFQLKRDFSGFFLDPLKIIRNFGKGSGKAYNEKSVVRPTYSYRGDYTISDRVFEDIIENVAYLEEGIHSVTRVTEAQYREGMKIEIALFVSKDKKIVETVKDFQKKVCEKIEEMTAFNVLSLDIEVKGIK